MLCHNISVKINTRKNPQQHLLFDIHSIDTKKMFGLELQMTLFSSELHLNIWQLMVFFICVLKQRLWLGSDKHEWSI